jgi:hypothetical protein
MHDKQIRHQEINNRLSWITPVKDLNLVRAYSREFPVSTALRWEGPADEILWENPGGKTTRIALSPNAREHQVDLGQGVHHFRLENKDGASVVLPVEIYKAPEIYTFWPLPRDRFTAGAPVSFSWSKDDLVAGYRMVILNANQRVFSQDAGHSATTNTRPPLEGAYEWTVEGYDALGFSIPPYTHSAIYFLKNPLAAPVLETPRVLPDPEIRQPASKPQKKRILKKPRVGWWLWMSLIPEAQAETATGYRALFRWQKVEGAARYVLEIDRDGKFSRPLVQETLAESEFLWRNFKLGHYYWRVAAEGKNGEMGLFSPVTEVDLTKPEVFTPPPEELAKREPPKPSARAKHHTPVVMVKPVAKPVGKPKPLPPPPPPIVAQKPRAKKPPPAEAAFERPMKGHFLWMPAYEFSQGSGDAGIQTSFRGLNPLALDLRLDFPIGARDTDVTFQVSYLEREDKPLPEKDYPFQEDIHRDRLSAKVLYGESRDVKFGLATSSFQLLRRAGFEKITSEESMAYGPAVLWPLTEELELEAGILAANKAWLVDASLRYSWRQSLGESLNLEYGGAFEASFLSSDSYRETDWLPKLFLGLSW